MAAESQTVECVGWLLVDEDGRYDFYGAQTVEFDVDQEDADSYFLDGLRHARGAAINKFGVVTQIYEIRFRVPRPSRSQIFVDVDRPITRYQRALAEVFPLEPEAPEPEPEEAAEAEFEPPADEPQVTLSDEQVAGEPGETVDPAKEAEADKVAEKLGVAEQSEWALKLLHWLDCQDFQAATATRASLYLERSSSLLVEDCDRHPWFSVLTKGRGHQIRLSDAGRAALED